MLRIWADFLELKHVHLGPAQECKLFFLCLELWSSSIEDPTGLCGMTFYEKADCHASLDAEYIVLCA